MSAIRDISRRKLRSSLTIFGIAIGVFTLVVLGAFAENANVVTASASRYYEHRVVIADAKDVTSLGYSSGNRPLSLKRMDEIRNVQGVEDVVPQVAMLLDPNQPVTGGSPSMVLGGFMGTAERPEAWRFSKGRGFSETESGVAVVGTDLARQRHAEIGEQIKVHGKGFAIVGIMDKSLTLLDQSVMIPFADAQQLFVKSLPKAIRESIAKKDVAMNFLAYAEAGEGNEDLAARINRQVKGVKATGITEMKKYLSQTIGIIIALMFAVGAIALLIGGLSVTNTMTMSVSERTREIGIKRAMGASTGLIMREILIEAAAISGVGGLLGVAAGALGAIAVNAATTSSFGVVLLMVTPRLATGTAFFAVALGVLAGLHPAWRAARMNPIAALGYE